MDPVDLVAQLEPIRLPADYARFGLRDALAAASIAILAALALVLAARPLFAPRRDPLGEARRAIDALRGEADEVRVFALARMLARLSPDAAPPPDLNGALYARAPADLDRLEAAVLAAAGRRAGGERRR